MEFDISHALSGIYLWLIFGIALSLFNCKIIKIINKYLLLQYITLLLSIFFLFIVIEPENSKKHLSLLFLNSLIIFTFFILLVKINKFISLGILVLILINQMLKVHINYMINNNIENNNIINNYKKIRNYINISIIILIFIGFIFVIIENKNKFSLIKFFKNNKC